MLKTILFVLILCFLCKSILAEVQKWEKLGPRSSSSVQEEAVSSMLRRILGEKVDFFDIDVDERISKNKDKAVLQTKTRNGKLILSVKANSGVAAAWGIGHYIKYYCNGHFSWDTVKISIPEPLPYINLTLETHEKFKYWQNVCTYGYSYVFWHWSDWEKHIDWMALNGINLALAFTGQEAIWYKIYLKLGLSASSIDPFFSGPAFLPWNRMGNMNGFGGPLSEAFIADRVYLQHKILNRMRDLGIIPVLPAFVGYVPNDFQIYFPNATVTKMGPWSGFNKTTLLDFADPLFEKISKMFTKEYIYEFGTDHAYNCDAFNEIIPKTNDTDYLSKTARSVYSSITQVDPDAVWIVQGWMFLSAQSFWQQPQIKAFLTANPIGSMLMLDLDSTYLEQYTRTHGYYGQPFIFNNLNNYGGAIRLFGRSNQINERIFTARKKYSNLVGIGFTPEGLTNSYAPTELMSEMSWRKKPLSPKDLSIWYQNYAIRRYGTKNQCYISAWNTLSKSVFNAKARNFHCISFLTEMPSLNVRNYAWYSSHDLVNAWKNMVSCLSSNPNIRSDSGFKLDLLDITRQVIADLAPYWFYKANNAFRNSQVNEFLGNMTNFIDILNDLDVLLNTDERFMIGKWIQSARNWGNDKKESDLFEFNARNQVTIWGPSGQILDYAAKEWGGLMNSYYIPRFVLYFQHLLRDLALGQKFDQGAFSREFLSTIGIPFSSTKKAFPVVPTGETITVVEKIFKKWGNVFTADFLNFVDKNAIKA